MDTRVEQRMRHMSGTIRAKPDWMDKLNDAEAVAEWTAEAKAKELTDIELRYVLDELQYYSSLHIPGSSIRLSATEGVWISDSLIDAQTTNALKDYAAVLASVPSRQKDWHPKDRARVLNLIDPSLFPLIYGCSKLCLQTTSSPQAALNPAVPGEFPGSIEKWSEILGELGYYVPKARGAWWDWSFSKEFCWLPSEFRVDDNGAVTIESYINNLHPVKHAAFYPIIASVFSQFIPLLEQVVTDLVHPRQPRVEPGDYEYKSDELEPEGVNYWEEEHIEWRSRATFVPPQPEPFVAPERPVKPYSLCDRRLQAIVRMSNIELTDKRSIYGGNDWKVAGLDNERIIATGIFFYDMANITQRSLQFREALRGWDFVAEHFDIDSVIRVYGLSKDDARNDDYSVSQELGDVEIKDGRCVVFPNIFQHKMPELRLVDRTKPGHCKILVSYFVDPTRRIPSTEIVPPQQQEWCFEDVLEAEPFRSLPSLVIDGIIDKVDYPISLRKAKRVRLQVRQDARTDKKINHELFEPSFFFSF
ncbi:hypothetical protein GGI21_000234 [Coemansia aciculifera]|nr:hypothetical protein GGI21_000234 [Coemansia aciculifera]